LKVNLATLLEDFKGLTWSEFVEKYNSNKNMIRKLLLEQVGYMEIEVPDAELITMTITHNDGRTETFQLAADIDFSSGIESVSFKKGKRVFKVEDVKSRVNFIRAKVVEFEHEPDETIITLSAKDGRQGDKRFRIRKGYVDLVQEKMRKTPAKVR